MKTSLFTIRVMASLLDFSVTASTVSIEVRTVLLNTPHALGAAVRGERMRLGMSQAELGERAGLSVTSVKLLEAGRGNPTLDSLLRVTAVLGMALSAQPAQNDRPSRNLPRSTASQKRARALALRHAAERSATSELASDPPTSPGVTPAAKVAEMMKKKKKKKTASLTRDRDPFDLDAHLASLGWTPIAARDLEPDVEMDPDPGDALAMDPEPTTSQLRETGSDA